MRLTQIGLFDLDCDDEALLHLYASQWQREEAMKLGVKLGEARGQVQLEQEPGVNPFDEARSRVPGGNCGRRWRQKCRYRWPVSRSRWN